MWHGVVRYIGTSTSEKSHTSAPICETSRFHVREDRSFQSRISTGHEIGRARFGSWSGSKRMAYARASSPQPHTGGMSEQWLLTVKSQKAECQNVRYEKLLTWRYLPRDNELMSEAIPLKNEVGPASRLPSHVIPWHIHYANGSGEAQLKFIDPFH